MKTVSKRKDGRPVFSSSQVLKRKEIFRGRLFDIVKSHHQVNSPINGYIKGFCILFLGKIIICSVICVFVFCNDCKIANIFIVI